MNYRVYFNDFGWEDAREARRLPVSHLPQFTFFVCRVDHDDAEARYRAQCQGMGVTPRSFVTEKEAAIYAKSVLKDKTPAQVQAALDRAKAQCPPDPLDAPAPDLFQVAA